MPRVPIILLSFGLHCLAKQHETGLIMQDSFRADQWPFDLMEDKRFVQALFNSQLFVDKSLLIKEFLEDGNRTYLISCPRRWGKSVNLDMIRKFFEIQTDSEGNEVPLLNSSNYRLFVNGEVTLDGRIKKFKNPFIISKNKAIVEKYLGKWPVIHLNLHDTRFANSVESAILKVGQCIRQTFLQHKYVVKLFHDMMSNEKSDDKTRATGKRWLNRFEFYSQQKASTNRKLFAIGINFLSKVLRLYFKTKVLILMDEYFMPWEALLPDTNNTQEDREFFANFYSDFFLKTFTRNIHVQKAIITGVYPASQELREYALKNITECNSLTGKFMEYYGFNQWEVVHIYDRLNISSSTQTEISQWYNGYKINNRDVQIFSLWSMISFLSMKTFDTYWINTGCIRTMIESCFQITTFKSEFELLLEGGETLVDKSRQYFSWAEYEESMRTWIRHEDTLVHEHHCNDRAFMFLYIHGYLTLSEDTNVNPNSNYYSMKFPNIEISTTMKWKWELYKQHPPSTRMVRRIV